MEIDITGANGVIDMIEQVGLNKFIITRYGTNNVMFDSQNTSSVKDCQNAFQKWASVMNNSNVYEITLRNDGKGKEAKTVKFTFQLKANEAVKQEQINSANNFMSIQDAINMAVDKVKSQHREDMLMTELLALKKKVEEREQEEEEEDDDYEENGHMDGLTKLAGVFANLLTNQNAAVQGASVNGISEDNQNDVNNVINRLHKYDKEIINDLNKLADVAEKNTAMFNTLVQSLRSL